MKPSEERAKGVVLPDWWLKKVRELVDLRGTTLTEVAAALSRIADHSWDHSAVSRFLRNKITTAPMAEAFSILLGLPPAFFVPRTWDEALALQSTVRRYDSPELTADQVRRLRIVDEVAESDGVTAKDQTDPVGSRDERAGRSGRAGRSSRGRSPTS